MSTTELDAALVKSLRRIERAVLAEVPLRRGSVITIWVALAALAVASLGTWVSAVTDHDCPLAGIAVGLGFAAAAVSTVAVIRRHFAPCWVAAVLSGIGVPLTVFGYWALQTANNGATCVWLLLAAAAHIVLVAQWVRCGLPAVPGAATRSAPPARTPGL